MIIQRLWYLLDIMTAKSIAAIMSASLNNTGGNV